MEKGATKVSGGEEVVDGEGGELEVGLYFTEFTEASPYTG